MATKKGSALIRRKEPEENEQPDLFFCDVVDVSIKDSRHAMALPFLSLSKRPRFEPIHYVNDNTGEEITVSGSKPFGIATIWDFDIMIWLFGQIATQINNKEKPSRYLAFHAYDLLRGIQRTTSGTDYDRLEAALRRLQSTTIHTNVDNHAPTADSVGWLDSVRVNRDAQGRAQHIEVAMSEWIFAKVTDPQRILTLHKNYFLLTSGVAKQLYRIARKMAGNRSFRISMPELAKRAGADDFKNFYESVRQIAAQNNDQEQAFPEYRVLIEKKGKGRTLTEMVTFEPREYRRALATKAEPKPGYQTPYRGAGAFDISDDAYDEAKLYCRTHDLDFHTVYEGWKNSQFKKHMEFIIQHGRPPLKDPGKAFLGYLAKVVQNKFR
jgi:plasmid replication initiation protein